MLISDLAIQYYELIGLDRRKEVLRNALASARRSHELTRQLKKEGAETQLAVDQFYARVLLIESKLLENDQLIGEKERAIACLLGVFPFEIRRMGFDELRKLPVPFGRDSSEPLDIASGCTFRRDGVGRLQGGCDSGEGGFLSLVGAWRQWWFQCV
jgi:outer membrane protein TolC